MQIQLETAMPAPLERVYELLTNGAQFGEATGRPGKGGGSAGAYFSLFDESSRWRSISPISDRLRPGAVWLRAGRAR